RLGRQRAHCRALEKLGFGEAPVVSGDGSLGMLRDEHFVCELRDLVLGGKQIFRDPIGTVRHADAQCRSLARTDACQPRVDAVNSLAFHDLGHQAGFERYCHSPWRESETPSLRPSANLSPSNRRGPFWTARTCTSTAS